MPCRTIALPQGWGVAVAAYDLDGDLPPEVDVANDFGPDRLLWNRSTPGRMRLNLVEGEKPFTNPLSLVLGRDSSKAWESILLTLTATVFPTFS